MPLPPNATPAQCVAEVRRLYSLMPDCPDKRRIQVDFAVADHAAISEGRSPEGLTRAEMDRALMVDQAERELDHEEYVRALTYTDAGREILRQRPELATFSGKARTADEIDRERNLSYTEAGRRLLAERRAAGG